jgi:hypothetical protein
LEIVTKNYILKIDDHSRRHSAGKIMSKPCAPACVVIFEGLHELEYVPQWKEFLVMLERFIDAGFGIWLPPADLSDEEANT